jgi:hypothetical protein
MSSTTVLLIEDPVVDVVYNPLSLSIETISKEIYGQVLKVD